ncbi:PAS domain-containing protein [Methylobacterium sp. NEAU 140]|uniref:PAS domain-containing protein n=1 Tax=Methylobacterium sp. NEAU 140 TaxID=3064945 RepID=UPI00273273C9|nr:PAS domain-containing protein [Methylobacterium sp. NEAU 140]MDP4022569.1 PAS domain-containing protein [Methylobacterium sp. NEAU 140]
MQTDVTSTGGLTEGELAGALAGWARLPGLAAPLGDPKGVHLVLDEEGRVLHASPAAAALAAALRPADLARQIATTGMEDGGPRLVRLRLDPLRIAPPVLCLLARGTRPDGRPLVLLVPAGPVTLPRRRATPPPRLDEPAAPPEPPAASSDPAPAPLRAGDRFLWRSDGAGTLTAVTGADALARLVGQDWPGIAGSGRLVGGDAALAALAARATFRAVPVSLDLGEGPVEIELSGAPLGRGEAGFGGFGLVRRVPAPPAEAAEPSADAPAVEAPSPVPSAADAEVAPAMVEAAAVEADGVRMPEAEAPASTADAEPAPEAEPVADAPWDRPAEPAPDDAEPGGMQTSADAATAPPDPALSSDEHAAFREIARALGARYAGDDEVADAGQPRPAGAVMLFPGPQAEPRLAGSVEPAGASALLEGLPVPILVHRDDAILGANRAFLTLIGLADRATLLGPGISRLFRGAPPERRAEAGAWQTAIRTAAGGTRPVEVLRGTCDWADGPAECLILRPLGEDDPERALAAERLARQVQAARALGAEAALDAVQAGVVTLDAAGRVVALNRAAAELFGCDSREVVGASFAGLFGPGSAASVAEAQRGADGAPSSVALAGRPALLAFGPPRADGHRVAVIQSGPSAPGAAAAEAPRALDGGTALLARLDRELRSPMSGIVALTDTMLQEPFGPFGSPRYRDCLAEIKVSGERLLERVAELLDLAAVEAGGLDLDPRPLALNEVVAGCVARLQPEAARGRIVLRTSFSADLGELEADEPTVSRAARLVIEHAIRRAAVGGQVIVSTGAADGAGIALRVRDTGATRPAEETLGLALPRALVEANGGRLRLSGRADEGTLVEIVLPARRAAAG